MTKPIFTKILIANRGEIAIRLMRAVRELGAEAVAIYPADDRDSLHVQCADVAVQLPGEGVAAYLDAPSIVAAALRSGCAAVHPGYGFLSEKSGFARAVRERGVTFIGPNPDTLDAFGDKMKARHVAVAAGTQPVPGTNEPIPVGTPEGVEQAKKVAAEVGYPIVVKAVGGGGGIGMQVVKDESGLERALKSCSDRAAQAFSDARIYLERYVGHPRHIEVQVFCDAHGNAVALGERECSVQRRHQKIVEESPSPLLVGDVGARARAVLFDRALRVVKSVGYLGAGTVEFIVDGAQPEEPYFLEVNARLQVEHPVTEMCTGLDLVEAQLRVACGEPLAKEVLESKPRGHAIEVRINAEEPRKQFLPRPGPVDVVTWPTASATVRVEAGVEAGSKVTPYYDSMIAKIIAFADDRPAAIARLDAALAELHLAPVVHNGQFLRDVLGSDAFRSGDYDTLFAEAFAKQLPK